MTLGLLEFLSEYTQMDCESDKETVFWKTRDDCNPIKEEFEPATLGHPKKRGLTATLGFPK